MNGKQTVIKVQQTEGQHNFHCVGTEYPVVEHTAQCVYDHKRNYGYDFHTLEYHWDGCVLPVEDDCPPYVFNEYQGLGHSIGSDYRSNN